MKHPKFSAAVVAVLVIGSAIGVSLSRPGDLAEGVAIDWVDPPDGYVCPQETAGGKGLRSFRVGFTEPTDLWPAEIVVSDNWGRGTYVSTTEDLSGDGTEWEVTFDRALGARTTVWVTFPTGETITFGALPGDVNQDGAFNVYDTMDLFDALQTGLTDPKFHDIDGDSKATLADLELIQTLEGCEPPTSAAMNSSPAADGECGIICCVLWNVCMSTNDPECPVDWVEVSCFGEECHDPSEP